MPDGQRVQRPNLLSVALLVLSLAWPPTFFCLWHVTYEGKGALWCSLPRDPHASPPTPHAWRGEGGIWGAVAVRCSLSGSLSSLLAIVLQSGKEKGDRRNHTKQAHAEVRDIGGFNGGHDE